VLDHCDVIRKESKEKDGQGTHEAENSGARLWSKRQRNNEVLKQQTQMLHCLRDSWK